MWVERDLLRERELSRSQTESNSDFSHQSRKGNHAKNSIRPRERERDRRPRTPKSGLKLGGKTHYGNACTYGSGRGGWTIAQTAIFEESMRKERCIHYHRHCLAVQGNDQVGFMIQRNNKTLHKLFSALCSLSQRHFLPTENMVWILSNFAFPALLFYLCRGALKW